MCSQSEIVTQKITHANITLYQAAVFFVEVVSASVFQIVLGITTSVFVEDVAEFDNDVDVKSDAGNAVHASLSATQQWRG